MKKKKRGKERACRARRPHFHPILPSDIISFPLFFFKLLLSKVQPRPRRQRQPHHTFYFFTLGHLLVVLSLFFSQAPPILSARRAVRFRSQGAGFPVRYRVVPRRPVRSVRVLFLSALWSHLQPRILLFSAHILSYICEIFNCSFSSYGSHLRDSAHQHQHRLQRLELP